MKGLLCIVIAAAVHGFGCSDDTASTVSSSSSTGGTGGSGGQGTGATGGGGSSAFDVCSACADPVPSGTLANPSVDETSGLVASAVHEGIYYVHNDSGDTARFFAIDAAGADQGTFEVRGASAVDWEDIARGPCPSGSCLFIGDFGDNAEARSDYRILRVPEPEAVGPGAHTVTAEVFAFSYPDGSHNAETLLVHPVSGQLTIVTKIANGPSGIYTFPPLRAGGLTLVRAGEFQPQSLVPLVTGGDFSPDGSTVLIRTYLGVWAYVGEPTAPIEAILGTESCKLPSATERQGESVGWQTDGRGFLTVSEGAGATVNRTTCQ